MHNTEYIVISLLMKLTEANQLETIWGPTAKAKQSSFEEGTGRTTPLLYEAEDEANDCEAEAKMRLTSLRSTVARESYTLQVFQICSIIRAPA